MCISFLVLIIIVNILFYFICLWDLIIFFVLFVLMGLFNEKIYLCRSYVYHRTLSKKDVIIFMKNIEGDCVQICIIIIGPVLYRQDARIVVLRNICVLFFFNQVTLYSIFLSHTNRSTSEFINNQKY